MNLTHNHLHTRDTNRPPQYNTHHSNYHAMSPEYTTATGTSHSPPALDLLWQRAVLLFAIPQQLAMVHAQHAVMLARHRRHAHFQIQHLEPATCFSVN
jgi:hypothetical protein